MKTFTASNGVRAQIAEGGSIRWAAPGSETFGNLYDYSVGSLLDVALAEFYRFRDDERVGRWRSSADPTWTAVVQSGSNMVIFRNDDGDRAFTASDRKDSLHQWSGDLREIAREYFAAHPEPKPLPDVDGIYAVSPQVHPYERLIQRRDGQWLHLRRSASEFENDNISAEVIAQSAVDDGRLTRLVPEVAS